MKLIPKKVKVQKQLPYFSSCIYDLARNVWSQGLKLITALVCN